MHQANEDERVVLEPRDLAAGDLHTRFFLSLPLPLPINVFSCSSANLISLISS